jgi:hypothetical protein
VLVHPDPAEPEDGPGCQHGVVGHFGGFGRCFERGPRVREPSAGEHRVRPFDEQFGPVRRIRPVPGEGDRPVEQIGGRFVGVPAAE